MVRKPAKNPAAVKQRRSSGKRRPNKTSFKPGNPHVFRTGDPRINRNGRPKSHDELRELIQALASDPDENGLTRIEQMLLAMFASAQPADRSNLLEHGWGKVPQAHTLSGDKDNPIIVKTDDLEKAEQELGEWRKKMTERLSGLSVVPTPDTSSTPTA